MDERFTKSEPTTGEIVRILRGYADDIRARAATDIPTPPEAIAADLLEGYKRVVVDRDREIAALTARAEQAEAREKAALREIERNCITCGRKLGFDTKQGIFICALPIPCQDANEREKWTWRGQPQDGEEK